jgi:two-component system, chemotaxis family, CheB/CheR fusion protein
LLLGASESVGGFSDLFTPVDHKHRIYVKNVSAGRQYPHFSAPTMSGASAAVSRAGALPISSGDWQREADRLALGQYAPPGVLVNDALEILQLRGQTGPYLALAPGEPSFKLLKMAREGLLFELRAALTECRERNTLARRAGVRVLGDEGDVREIELEVMPVTLPGTPERCFLVQFVSRAAGEPGTVADGPSAGSSDSLATPTEATAAEREVVSLHQELTSTREYLESVIEQQEASHEELRSANEEILSANEELQSTNEELETAKEELQSVNEELTTVNEQLQIRNADLARLDDDATNLFTSANVPMVVVGVDLRLRRYTAAAGKLLELNSTDVGRPLITLRLPVDVPDLETMAEEVIDRVQVREREVLGRDGRMYTLRIHPYRTADKRIDGAVIVLVDIDELAQARTQMALAHAQLQAVVDTVWEPLVVLDADSRVVSANRPLYEKFKVMSGEVTGRLLFDLAEGRWDVAELRQQLDDVRARGTELRELEVAVELEGVRRVFLLNARRLSASRDEPERTLLAFEEVTERRQMETGLRMQRDELVTAGHRKDEFLAMLAHELRNPLGPMSAAVQILRLTSDAPAEAQQAWAIMDRQVHHMTTCSTSPASPAAVSSCAGNGSIWGSP